VVGDVKASNVLKTVMKYYGQLKPQNPPEKTIPREPDQRSPRHKTMRLNTQVQKIMVAYPVPAVTHEDVPALQVMRTVLTGGERSRLYRALVDAGITTSIDTYDLDDKDPSILIFIANSQKGRRAPEVEEVLLREIERFKRSPIDLAELERAKNTLQPQFFDGLSA